jgi:hypothetical protein
MSLVTPVVMCVGVSPVTGIALAPTTTANITQDVQPGQKLLVIWRTMADNNAYGTTTGAPSTISSVGCTVGTKRTMYNGDDSIYLWYVTIGNSATNWSVTFQETTYTGFFGGFLYYYHRQSIVPGNALVTNPSISTARAKYKGTLASADEISFSDMYPGAGIRPGWKDSGTVSNEGEISASDFNQPQGIASDINGDLDQLNGGYFVAGAKSTNRTWTQGGGKGTVLYNHEYDIGYATSSSWGENMGSMPNPSYVGLGENGLGGGNSDRAITAFMTRNWFQSSTNDYSANVTGNKLHIRFNTGGTNNYWNGLGSLSASSSGTAQSGNSSTAGWHQLLVATDYTNLNTNTGQRGYVVLDMDDATITAYDASNDYVDVVWPSVGMTFESGVQYNFVFLDWDV